MNVPRIDPIDIGVNARRWLCELATVTSASFADPSSLDEPIDSTATGRGPQS
jgi:hypothetical protein